MRGLVLCGYAALVVVCSEACAEDIDVSKYDFNKNGRIDPGRETEVFLKHRANAILRKYDTNFNGRLDPDEVARLNADIAADVARDQREIALKDPRGQGLQIDQVKAAYGLIEAQTWKPPFLIRDAYIAHSITVPPDPGKADAGAKVSYTKDFTTHDDIFGLTGAIMIPKVWSLNTEFSGDPNTPRITAISVAPGMEFDGQISRKSGVSDKSLLAFRFLGEVETQGGPPFTTQYFRLGGYYRTDFQGEASIYGIQAEWQPVNIRQGLGGARHIEGTPFSVRFMPVLRAEFERVDDAGRFKDVVSGSEYLRLGPQLEWSLWFNEGPFERLSLHARFWYLWNTINRAETKDRSFFQADALFRLDEAGNIAIDARYRNGRPPTTGIETHDFTIGLALKW